MIARCLTVLLIGATLTAYAEDKPKVDPELIKKLQDLKKQMQADQEKQNKAAPEKSEPKKAESGPKIDDAIATLTIEQGGEVLGDIVLELNVAKAPITVLNFADYAESGYYNGTIFHRVIPNFMIQGGGFTKDVDKKTEGLKAPITNEWGNGLKNEAGTIAMARLGGNPDSATSQFFINVVNNPNLDMPQRDGAGYCVFGKVVKGKDVVEKIKATKCAVNPKYPGGPVVPETPVIIKSVKIEKLDRDAAKKIIAKRSEALRDYAKKVADELGKPLGETESGLFYIILREGEGVSPTPEDRVTVHYEGTFLDGKKFDSSYDRGQPATFPLRGVIKGWTEGVSLMKVGEKRKLIIPWNLAYGARGKGSIPPKSDLVFDVELLSVAGK